MNEYELTSGESWTRVVTVWADELETEKFDLGEDSTATFKVYDAPGGNVVFTGQAEITDAANGEITVALAGGQTATRPLSVLYWVVRVNVAGDRIFDADSGKLVIRP